MSDTDLLIQKLVQRHGSAECLPSLDLLEEARALATDPDFQRILPSLPPALVIQLREIARNVKAHPEDIVVIHSYAPSPDSTAEADARFDAQDRLQRYWADRTLHDIFFPDEPLAPFEPIRDIGLVRQGRPLSLAEQRAFGVSPLYSVVLGEFDSPLIRDNPLLLQSPAGVRVPVHKLGFPIASDRSSWTPGLVVAGIVASEVPRSARLLVDRSAKKDIPALPRQ